MAAVPSVCPNRLALLFGLDLAYCSNRPLDVADPTVLRAVVAVHGNSRNAPGLLQSITSAATTAGTTAETIIIAPHFLTEEDVDTNAPGNNVAYWTGNGWKQGDDSLSTSNNPRPGLISSFDVLDKFSARLTDPAFFPNLRLLVIAGHSAGGQFVNRYAAAHTTTIATRYIVANPASYLYMNDERHIAGTLDQFAIPTSTDCPAYDQYKYGLQGLNPYMTIVGAAAIVGQYPLRRVVYLLGTNDNDPNHPDLDQDDCAAGVQGAHRFERGTIYFNHVQHVFGPSILTQHTLVPVVGVGHSAGQMFRSPEGVQELFPPLPAPPKDPLEDAAVVASAAQLLLHDDQRIDDAPVTDEIFHRPGAVTAGAVITGTIELAEPAAPAGGRVVTFTADDPAKVTLTNVIVPAGATRSPFSIGIAETATNSSVVVTARSGFVKRTQLDIPSRGVRHLELGSTPGQHAPVLGLIALGSLLYATHYDNDADGTSVAPGELITIDAGSLQVLSRSHVGFAPRSVAINLDTRRLYVVNSGKDSYSVSVLDLSDPVRPEPVATIAVGQIPIDVAVDQATNRILVSNPSQGLIHIVDGSSHTHLAPIVTGRGVVGLAFDSASNRLWATRTELQNQTPMHSIVSARGHDDGTFTVVPSPPWPLPGAQPIDVAIDMSAMRLYVATLGSPGVPPAVAIFDADTLALITTMRTNANPHAIIVDSKRDQLYIGTDAGLQIADTTTASVVSTVHKTAPWGVAAETDTGQVYFGSARQGTVSHIAAPDLAPITRWATELAV